MKQSVEEQIHDIFEKWDEQKSDIGFNKEALWNKMPVADENKKRLPWFRIAAVIIIFFLSSALTFTFYQKENLEQKQIVLQDQINALQNTKPMVKTLREEKIVYKTKEIVSEKAKNTIQQLSKDKLALQSKIDKLRIKLAINSSVQKYLKDSIQNIQREYLKTQEFFAKKFADLKNVNQNQPLDIEIDEEALLALKEEFVVGKDAKKTNNLSISLKNQNKAKEKTTSIFQSFTKN